MRAPVGRTAGVRPWLLVAAGVALAVVLIGPRPDDGEPLDPAGSGPQGALGLVRTLERLGADVAVSDGGAPSPQVDVALVLADRLADDRREQVRRWAEAGGTLVVADPSSPLLDVGPVAELEDPRRDAGGCGIEALAEVEEVSVEGVGFDLGVRGRGCLAGEDGSSYVVATPVGDGTVVAVGGAAAFTNERLGSADNAVLAAALLAPRPGTRVSVLVAAPAGTGTASLPDLVGDDVRQGLLQLGLAFLLYALWRGRRLGRPVEETQPVRLAASELTVAVGGLLHQGRHRRAVADAVRDDARRRLAERLGVAGTTATAEVAALAAARTGADEAGLVTLLTPAPIGGDDELVALAAATTDALEELTRAR